METVTEETMGKKAEAGTVGMLSFAPASRSKRRTVGRDSPPTALQSGALGDPNTPGRGEKRKEGERRQDVED